MEERIDHRDADDAGVGAAVDFVAVDSVSDLDCFADFVFEVDDDEEELVAVLAFVLEFDAPPPLKYAPAAGEIAPNISLAVSTCPAYFVTLFFCFWKKGR